ncbi:MAG TPA: GntR family transcriptional regulator [Candidatus Ruminococcus avistercoris]|nr:GntR family transcriptional regulator [Candidatus Ruminococcus avistercoris]
MPKYLSIAENIEEQIRAQIYLPHQKLPSEKELIDHYQVSRQTIRNALDFLRNRGLLYSHRGKGTFISELPETAAVSSNNIAVILNALNDYIFPYKIAGINSVLTENDYISNIFTCNYSIDTQEQILRNLLQSTYAGAIIEVARGYLPRMHPQLLKELSKKMPVILIDGHYPELPDLPAVCLDDFRSGYLATEYLIQKGHRKIFHFGKMDDIQGILRYRGYIQALLDNSISPHDDDTFWLTGNDNFIYTEINYNPVISRLGHYTAAYFYNDLMAQSIVPEILKRGIRIPEDLSLMSNDDYSPNVENIALSGIRYPRADVGQKAAQNLLQLIKDPNYDANYLFEPELVEHDSVREIIL